MTTRVKCERCGGDGKRRVFRMILLHEVCDRCGGTGVILVRITAEHLYPATRAMNAARGIDPDQAPRVVAND
jgi:hypothetical protein